MTDSFADTIVIRGACEHNLDHVDLDLPKHRLIVFTGVSGSGKSSLAFDTLYAEGQRRYVESLSAYARQFLGQMDKPRYDTIRGLSPTISIEQRAAAHNPRSTVGTVTEIHDYLRVLFARVGVAHCPSCDRETSRTGAHAIIRSILERDEGARILVLAPLARSRKGTFERELADLSARGFVRVRVDGEVRSIEDVGALDKNRRHDVDVVVDRLAVRADKTPRLADSVEAALRAGEGRLVVAPAEGPDRLYSEARHCPYCDVSLPNPTPALFSFNSPIGACRTCNGLGTAHEVDLEAVVPNPELSLREGCVAPWAQAHGAQQRRFSQSIRDALAKRYDMALDVPWKDLPEAHRGRILDGTGGESLDVVFSGRHGETIIPLAYEGVLEAIRRHSSEATNGATRDALPYMREVSCPDCHGERLRAEARATKVGGRTLPDLSRSTIGQLHAFFTALQLEGAALEIATEILREVRARLGFLADVGLTYLTLDRRASSLSGGEAQRIRLASQVGSELTGVLYVLDEPSIGLHARDNLRLLRTLTHLVNIGNTVIVVEHDAETMRAADHLVDFGPGAGRLGGRVVATGSPADLEASAESLTGGYLSGARRIEIPARRRGPSERSIVVAGARQNNLRGVDVAFPVGRFTVVTGVSGAGKSSLVNGILHPALANRLNGASQSVGAHTAITGVEHASRVVCIDQTPIGRTPRSNPATYTKVFDAIRQVYAATRESRVYGYQPGRFSFNVKGGRCEACEGAGVIKIEMHFLPDVYVSCETCKGRRFNEATLRVRYKGLSISEVLGLTIEEAHEHFSAHPRIARVLDTLRAVGLGYVHLGQPATTLSGGEAQRVKLSRELAKKQDGRTVYILDEPSVGLHFEDVRKLLAVTDRLVDSGNTVIMVEHNLDIIKTADHVIDLGPEGGAAGGEVVATGPPEAVARAARSYTGQFLRSVLP